MINLRRAKLAAEKMLGTFGFILGAIGLIIVLVASGVVFGVILLGLVDHLLELGLSLQIRIFISEILTFMIGWFMIEYMTVDDKE